MRIYKNCGPYYGRSPERRQQQLGGTQREAAPNPSGGTYAKGNLRSIGDVRDDYLRGRGSNLFSPAHYGKKKRHS